VPRAILITGASSGLGRACADLLAQQGDSLVLVGRQGAVLREAFPSHVVIDGDVQNEESHKAIAAEIKKQSILLDGVVLAAGIQEIRPLMMEGKMSLSKTWEVNVLGTLGLLGQLLKARLVQKGGSIVLFSSAATHAGGAGLVSYAASKGALEAATKSLALELASQRIRVNAIAPGVVKTPMSDAYMKRLTPEQVAHVEQAHPLGFGTPEDIAGPVAFLLSPAARWITGTVLLVDGGLTSH
jgi:NAD(P)-dependent dehydrogenase (short-subunit alcohol dehydrogenase family)